MTRKVIVIICAVLALVIGGFAVADELRGTGQGKQQEEETDSEEAETVSPDAEVKSGLSKAHALSQSLPMMCKNSRRSRKNWMRKRPQRSIHLVIC